MRISTKSAERCYVEMREHMVPSLAGAITAGLLVGLIRFYRGLGEIHILPSNVKPRGESTSLSIENFDGVADAVELSKRIS